jgi:hypothetical protein
MSRTFVAPGIASTIQARRSAGHCSNVLGRVLSRVASDTAGTHCLRFSIEPTITLAILRLASAPSRRCASLRPATAGFGLDCASFEPGMPLRDARRTYDAHSCWRSDRCCGTEAAGAGQSREAPTDTEGRIELRQRFRRMKRRSAGLRRSDTLRTGARDEAVREVGINRQCLLNPQLLHNDKADAIDEAVILILVLLEIIERGALFVGRRPME